MSSKTHKECSVVELPKGEDLITISQASEITKLKIQSLRNLISTKKIPAFKNGRYVCFSKAELISWQASRVKRIGGASNG
ncbi:MAG: helix-turn-helix domain-containing protein [Bacteroidia bacterium]